MATPEEINDALAENALGPRSVTVGNENVQQHPLADQIAAANHLAGQQAATKPGFGLRFQQIKPVYR